MNKTKYLAAAILGAALFVSLGLVVRAQTTDQPNPNPLANITYPVSQLGNCSSQSDCMAYCNDASHMQACIQFAQSHGLVGQAEASQEKSFAQTLAQGAGPGGCNSPDSCNSYCTDVNHLETCLSFAKDHGLMNTQAAEQGQKILTYIQSGGQMPGGCTSQSSCESYCNNLSHAAECFAFSQKVGITPPNGNGGPQPTLDQLQKMSALAQSGQTPGGCTTMQACQEYCNDPSHSQACQQFGQAIGFTGGPDRVGGPGGCNSPDSCQAYCNDQNHQAECLKFAENHGLMSQGQVQNFQSGMNQVQNGLKNAPPQVLSCLQTQVGGDVLSQIQSGQFTPTPDVMDKMKTCFESFRPSSTSTPEGFVNQGGGQPEQTVGDVLKNAPPEVVACIKNKLGGNLPDSSSPADQNFGQSIKTCFDSYKPNPGQNNQPNGQPNSQSGPMNQEPPMNGNGQFPPQGENGGPNNQFQPMGTSSAPFNQPGPMPSPSSTFEGQPMMPPQNQLQPNQPENMTPPPPENGSPAPVPSSSTQPTSLRGVESFLGNILDSSIRLLTPSR